MGGLVAEDHLVELVEPLDRHPAVVALRQVLVELDGVANDVDGVLNDGRGALDVELPGRPIHLPVLGAVEAVDLGAADGLDLVDGRPVGTHHEAGGEEGHAENDAVLAALGHHDLLLDVLRADPGGPLASGTQAQQGNLLGRGGDLAPAGVADGRGGGLVVGLDLQAHLPLSVPVQGLVLPRDVQVVGEVVGRGRLVRDPRPLAVRLVRAESAASEDVLRSVVPLVRLRAHPRVGLEVGEVVDVQGDLPLRDGDALGELGVLVAHLAAWLCARWVGGGSRSRVLRARRSR